MERALDRLDQASRARAVGNGTGDDALRREVTALRTRCALLEDRARTVSDRLDSAIDRVKSALES